MKKIIFILLLFSCQLFSQTNAVQVTNNLTGKAIILNENTRVKVKTIEGKKYFGRLKIIDSTSIELKGQKILLNDINVFKRRSVGSSFVSAGLIFIGASAVAMGTILILVDIPSALILISSGGISTTIGALLPDFNNGHHSNRWKYKIIEKEKL